MAKRQINRCKVIGCIDKKYKAKGYCTLHYDRYLRHGDPSHDRASKGRNLFNAGKYYCPSCKEVKDLLEFNKDRSTTFGIARYCRSCNKRKSNSFYLSNKRLHKNTQLKSDFGIDYAEYERLLVKQSGRCAICFSEITSMKWLSVDHCHISNKVRGLLCSECNLALGKFKDDVALLENAISYLKENSNADANVQSK